jgi:hypothetical protein
VLVFNDLHLALAVARAGDAEGVARLRRSLDDYQRHGRGDNRDITVDVGRRLVDGALAFAGCTDGAAVTGGIRAAFQMVEPAHGLQKRGETGRSFPVQAIAVGKQVTILALSGEAALPEGVNPRGLIFAPFSNDTAAAPQDADVRAAIQRVLARVK